MNKAPHQRGAPSLLRREIRSHPARFSLVRPLRFRSAPLLYAAAAFAAGTLLSQCWRPAAMLVVATALLLGMTALAIARTPRLAVTCMLLTWVGLGWALATLRPPAVPQRALLPYADGLRRTAYATVVNLRPLAAPALVRDEDPLSPAEQAWDTEALRDEPRVSVDLDLSAIEQLDPDTSRMEPTAGGARVLVDAGTAAQLRCGAAIQAVVRLYRPRTFRDPGVWSYAEWLAGQDITATGQIVPRTVHLANAQTTPLLCRMSRLRTWASARLTGFSRWQSSVSLPAVLRWNAEDTAAWNAMLFGDRTNLTHSLRSAFERTGTFHLFVVAGLHVGLVAAAVFWLAKRTRMPQVVAVLLTASATAAYALFTGFGPPVQRALWMTLAYLFASSLSRERNVLNAIGAAMLAMLAAAPQVFRESSFQMTVLIAVTIGGIAVPLLERTVAPYARACRRLHLLRLDATLPPHLAQFRVAVRWWQSELTLRYGRWIATLFLLSLRVAFALAAVTLLSFVTEVVMTLPMAFYFHRVTATALPSNLLVIPLLAPMMAFGLLAFALCLVSFPLALAASVPAALLLHTTKFVVRTIAGFSVADLRTPGPGTVAACGIALLVALSVVLVRSERRAAGWTGLGCAVGVCVLTLLSPRSAPHAQALQVAAIDVGQGDSILVVGPGGHTLLMDAGGTVGAEQDLHRSSFDPGEEVVSAYLWARGIRRLDVLALSHAHMDHLGGMSAVLRNFRPRELWLSVDAHSPTLRALVADAKQQGATVRHLYAGDRFAWNGVDATVLSPTRSYVPGAGPTNDDSLVMRLQYGRASALLEGDAELPSESLMLAAHAIAPVTLLKVGHHGSLTSTSEALLNAATPQAAVISCGRANHFGHPRMPVLERLQQRHIATSRTDTMGAVEYTLHADGSLSTIVPSSLP